MTSPPPTPQSPPTNSSGVRLFRRDPNGPVAGVATGLANMFGVDPVLVQVIIVAAAIGSAGGAAMAYLAAWALVPHHDDTTSTDRFAIKPSISASTVIGLMIGSLIVVGVIGDQSTALVVPGILIAGGFYFLNQRSVNATPVHSPPPPRTPPPPQATSADPYSWAVPKVEPDESPPSPTPDPQPAEPVEPAAPTPPITAVTLAAVAASIALLALINGLFDLEVHAAAFIGLATAITGIGMVAASVLGRARALIPLGFLSIAMLVISPIVDSATTGGFGPREITVRDEATLEPAYTLGAGYFELDLRPLELAESRTINVDLGAGYTEIYVPSDMNVEVIASNTAGYIGVAPPAVPGSTGGGSWTSGGEVAGVDNNYRWSQVIDDGPTLTIIANVGYGSLEVTR